MISNPPTESSVAGLSDEFTQFRGTTMICRASQTLAALTAILFGSILSSVAQPNEPASRPAVPTIGAVELGEPLHLDEIGLTMRIPADCRVNSTWIGDLKTAQIVPATTSWVINIQTPRIEGKNPSLKEVADQTIQLLQGSVGVMDAEQKVVLETRARILERHENLSINDQKVARFYVAVPRADDIQLVKGYTIFQPGGPSVAKFVVFELLVPEADFAAAKAAYETSIATAQFLDPERVSRERGLAIRAGQELIRMVSPSDYEQWMDGQERWYRLYRPAASGAAFDAEEIGYRGVRFWKGQRGEIDPGKGKGAWTRADRQQGYLASVRGRVMTPQGPADSEAIYFLLPDRTEEAWSIRMVVRDRKTGRELIKATEVGARNGQDLSVVVEQPGQPSRTLQPFFQSDGYLSQVDVLLLPRIFAAKSVEADFAFYAYQPQIEGVTMRRERVSGKGRGGNAVWTIESTVSEDSPTQTGIYDHRGDLLRVTTGDDLIWEPTELRPLLTLWEQKGLPTSAIKR